MVFFHHFSSFFTCHNQPVDRGSTHSFALFTPYLTVLFSPFSYCRDANNQRKLSLGEKVFPSKTFVKIQQMINFLFSLSLVFL